MGVTCSLATSPGHEPARQQRCAEAVNLLREVKWQCCSTCLTWSACAPPPVQSTLKFYDNDNQELAAANAYRNNPAKRFFDARVSGRQTWGVFENDFSKH